MELEHNNIELRSEEVEDILGKVPSWITMYGNMLLMAIIFILLAGTWLFKIPDVKSADVMVTSALPPAYIEARTDGKVEQLLVKDNEVVSEGAVLAVIENPADYEDVEGLKDILHDFVIPPDANKKYDLPVNGEADLGTIQQVYAGFFKNYRSYIEFKELNYHQRKINILREEYDRYKVFSRNLTERASILEEEYKLSYKQFDRDSLLFAQGVVSESVYEDTRSSMLSKRGEWHEVVSLTAENDIKIAGIREQILEMELKQQEQNTLLTSSLEESLNMLKGAIASWEKDYLIVAPIAGQVTFNNIWSVNQNVKSGEKVMTVIPEEESEMLGKILLPMKGAGEVQEGQQVNIRFDNFPYLEYGMVKGQVRNVSKVPQDEFYTVEVILPEGLTTYYGYEIDFSQDMKGNAEIITDNMRLLERIFNPVRNAITRQRQM